ncbi:MAG TPA: hypothetical protein VFT62_02585 [Mycobacteriales bacterium]|nr:hypothetical protein [Mycobacteriales bacterium]
MRRHVAAFTAAGLVLGVAVPTALAAPGRGPKAATYYVGGAVESINPDQVTLDRHDFFLGGYGFSSGRPGNAVDVPGVSAALGDRYAKGILGDGKFGPDGDGVHTRAFAVSDHAHTIVLAQIETQGYFDAYKQGPFGINEIRQDAAAKMAALYGQAAGRGSGHATGQQLQPPPTPEQIVVDSVHTHGGPDTTGVWGGVPTAYLELVHDQTVAAIVEAWQRARPAQLWYGVVHAGVNGEAQYPPQECLDAGHPDCKDLPKGVTPDWLLNNQFSYDPNNQVMDDQVRVLQARDDDGNVIATYSNFSAHPTVLGGDNRMVTADYVGRLDGMMAKQFGGFAMDQVATLGRTQPTDRGCSDSTVPKDDQDAQDLCALDQYAGRVLVKIKEAVAKAAPLAGRPQVAMNSYLLSDTTTSPVLAGIVYAGNAIGAPAGRAANAPWYTGTQLGTTYYVGRIGDILVTGGPGEMYPQIWQKVKDTVTGDASSGITSVMNIGTAGDFLGYIIAPLEAYPEPAYRSVASHDTTCNGVPDPVGVCPDPIGNDNYFFNISHTFGERLTCDFLRGAGDIVAGDPQKYWSTYNRCPAFATDLLLPEGQDMQFPQQPDLSSVLTHM